MKFRFLEVFSGTSSGAGIAYGIANFHEVLGIIVLIASLISTVLLTTLKVIDWYKKAKEDGKITADEVKEVVEVVKEGVDDIKDKADKGKEIKGNE